METTDTMKMTSGKRWVMPVLGFTAAIATNLAAQFGILSGLGALLLLPLLVVCWLIERFTRKEMGFVIGPARYYAIGLLHPLLVLSIIALIAWATGATNTSNANWSEALSYFALTAALTIPVTLLTEDGFFRGWLWASLKRAGMKEVSIAFVTGIAFGLWHLPYAFLGTGYDPLSLEVPLLILSASIIGTAWGLLRLISGSVLVAVVSHGVWNALVYAFFNNGSEIGALGIQNTSVFGPEAGLLGLTLNTLYAIGIWLLYRRVVSRRAPNLNMNTNPGLQR